MEKRAGVVPVLLLFVLLSFVATLPGSAALDAPLAPLDWPVECVDCPAGIELLGDHALRLDAAGNPRIAYGGEHLSYAHHDGAEWHLEIVDATDGVGEDASLALDAAGAPHILYDAPGTRELRYAWHDGASWHVEVVDGGIWFGGGGLSLALDAGGRAHASYYDWFHRTLKHAWREGATWHVEVVDGTGGTIGSTSLALDAGGHPHISYALGDYPAPGQFSVRYARYDGAAWHLETVYTGPNWGMETSLALDGAGLAHILLTQKKDYEGEDGAVYYARHDGSAWQLETVATGDVAAPALALDAAGEPRVAFEHDFWALGGLRYGWREGGAWHVDTVPDPARVGRSISLALDPAGRPHLAYLDEPGSPVRHVKHAW
ncbi:MAG TPA: hypothetical protein VLC95_14925, partial [Anaerolineae bacterium]|nr:hypothetical protein [Anaerolineae bacterium]